MDMAVNGIKEHSTTSDDMCSLQDADDEAEEQAPGGDHHHRRGTVEMNYGEQKAMRRTFCLPFRRGCGGRMDRWVNRRLDGRYRRWLAFVCVTGDAFNEKEARSYIIFHAACDSIYTVFVPTISFLQTIVNGSSTLIPFYVLLGVTSHPTAAADDSQQWQKQIQHGVSNTRSCFPLRSILSVPRCFA